MLTLGCLESVDLTEEAIHLDLDESTLARLAHGYLPWALEAADADHVDHWPQEMPESWLE
jgi:hypothetical protein